ncbi:MAG: hypothetical protein ACOY4L_03365 [Pseudomonadota bacterium]
MLIPRSFLPSRVLARLLAAVLVLALVSLPQLEPLLAADEAASIDLAQAGNQAPGKVPAINADCDNLQPFELWRPVFGAYLMRLPEPGAVHASLASAFVSSTPTPSLRPPIA